MQAERAERRLLREPKNESAWGELIRLRTLEKDWPRVDQAFTAWQAKVAKPSPIMDRMRGEVAFARGQWNEAIAAWLRYSSVVPDDLATRRNLATAYAGLKDWPRAIREISAAIEVKPTASALALRANYFIRLHDWNAAGADAREGNRLSATEAGIRQIHPIFERSTEWLPVISKLDTALTKDPNNVTLLLDRAEWLFGVGFFDAGTDDVQAAYKAAPKSIRARYWHRVIAWERGQRDTTGDGMEARFGNRTAKFQADLKTLDANADSEARAAFLLANRLPIMALEEVGESDGSSVNARALLELQRLPEAGAAARRAVEVRPEDSTAWLTLGQVELANGNMSEAIEAAKRSTRLKKTPEAEALRELAQKRLGKK